MNGDLKKYLRTNERLAKVVAAEICAHPGGWRELCVAIQLDDGTRLGDRFYLPDDGLPCPGSEGFRLQALGNAVQSHWTCDCAQWVGRQLIVTLDEKWNPEDYASPLASTNDGVTRTACSDATAATA